MSDITPTEGAAEPAVAPAFDPTPILERMDQFSAKLESFQPAAAAPAEPEAAPDPYAELGNYYDDEGQAAEARRALESILNPAVEQATKPLLDQIKALEAAQQGLVADLELGDLEARYPRLADDPEYTKGLITEAAQFAEQIGQPGLAKNAALIERLHLARLGAERAAGETPASGVPTGLEAAGGASPGTPEPNLAQSILQAGGERTAGHQFWGA